MLKSSLEQTFITKPRGKRTRGTRAASRHLTAIDKTLASCPREFQRDVSHCYCPRIDQSDNVVRFPLHGCAIDGIIKSFTRWRKEEATHGIITTLRYVTL